MQTAKAHARTFKAPRARVLIERSNNQRIPRDVFRHEIPLLRAMHGDQSVRVISTEPNELPPPSNLDIKAEWNRLMDVYGMHPSIEMPLVLFVFQNNLQAMVKAANDDIDAEDVEVSDDGLVSVEPLRAPSYEDVDELRQALGDLGVTFAKKDGKAALQDKLRAAVKEQLAQRNITIPETADINELMSTLAAAETGGE